MFAFSVMRGTVIFDYCTCPQKRPVNTIHVQRVTKVKGSPAKDVCPTEKIWRSVCGVAWGQPERCSGAARVELRSGRLEAGGVHCSSCRQYLTLPVLSPYRTTLFFSVEEDVKNRSEDPCWH